MKTTNALSFAEWNSRDVIDFLRRDGRSGGDGFQILEFDVGHQFMPVANVLVSFGQMITAGIQKVFDHAE